MFTGVIEARGIVRGLHSHKKDTALEIELPGRWKGLSRGKSLCVNGACLTVAEKKGRRAVFDLLSETRRRTNLGRLKPGESVNLERPMKWGARIDGHWVSGHVEGRGKIAGIKTSGREKSFHIQPPAGLMRFIREKGSVAVNGVSLTVGKTGKKGFWAHCIPVTLERTNLKSLKINDRVNLETEFLAKML